MKGKLIAVVCAALLFANCSKDGKGCWQAYDPQGYDAPGLILCDKTKTEAETAYPQFWFYKSGETKYCWKVEISGRTAYVYGIPESMARKQMQDNGAYRFTKIDCKTFCVVEWREKHKSKITAQFGPTRLIVERLCRRIAAVNFPLVRKW